jgi:O-antigen/teichoic acid export membrane protein
MSLRTLLSLITGVVGARLAGAVAALVTQVALARALEQSDMGIYFLAVSLSSIIGMLMTGGYSALGFTYLSRYRALGRRGLQHSYIRLARRDVALLCAVLVAAGCSGLAAVPMQEGARIALAIGLLSGPAVALIRLQGAIANSARRFSISFMPDFVLRPMTHLVFVLAVIAVTGSIGLWQAVLAFLAISYLVAGLQAWILWPEGVFVPRGPATSGPRAAILRRRAASLVIVALVTVAFGDIVILAAGLALSAEEVAVLGVCVRLAGLIGFVTQACYQFIIPDLTQALVTRDEREVRPVLLRANLLAMAVTGTALAGAVLVGDIALGVFGSDYAVGQAALALLCVGQIVRAAGGMNVNLLSLGGQQGRLALACLGSVAVLVAVALALAPAYGVLGVAWAVVASETAWAFSTALIAACRLPRRGDIVAVLRAARAD